jgi:hypothetical protein
MDDLFALFTERLAAAGVDAMVTGSVAAMVYGEPRLTNDIDIVAAIHVATIARLVAQFPVEEFYCAPAEVIHVEVLRGHRGHFNIIHHETGFKADIYVAGRDPLHAWALARARVLPLGATSVRIAPPEYVIVRKLEFYREGGSPKHVTDIRHMLVQLGSGLDTEILLQHVRQRGLESTWEFVANGSGEGAGE